MDVLSIFILMTLVGKCQGNIYLIYQGEKEDISLQCEGSFWQIDLDQNNKVDCTFNDIANDNKNKCDQDLNGKNRTLELEKKSCINLSIKQCFNMKLEKNITGFFACFRNVQSIDGDLFPFKPSKDLVAFYIVAFVESEMVIPDPGVETKTVTKQHGETVNLTCHFTIADHFSNLPFSVYWIKTFSGKNCTCVHSYSFDYNVGQSYDHHCLIDEALLNKMSNTSSTPVTNPHFHNLKISNATYSDSGQYVCALQVLKGPKGHWKVITNITVTVNGEFNNHTNRNDTALLDTPAESHTMRMKRDQDGEETLDSNCSPFAEGRGEEEGPYSLVKLTEVRDPVTAHNWAEEHAAVAAKPYSVVMFNTEYEAFDPQAIQTPST
ncbi:uncharacterized protein LOC121558912 isoform X2 [Coregonus clupeaformis]|uniref:uncharacterized protein LOC121558912 isoform X2 n=1 Tax=Coregonus clupeaformis TaxID=59861 RepID=UPI001E1C8DDD|nr:uncharacterized protein LOC121558912 isoform X2 [Coregonus clupeaformis]